VSRFFWPVNEDKLAQARGQNLRKVFSLNEGDPLFSARHIRNVVEHFDERLDRFCSRDPVGQIFDLIVTSNDIADAEVTHVLRLVDPQSETFVLFGKKYSYAGLEDCVARISDLAMRLDDSGGRLRTDR
jgi:hypothetical protein